MQERVAGTVGPAPAGLNLGGAKGVVIAVFVAAVVLFLASTFISPNLVSWSSLRIIIILSGFLAIAAFGQGIVIMTGGLDVSVGSVITLAGVLMAAFVPENNVGFFPAFIGVLVMAGAVGGFSGIGVAFFRIPPFVMTLATGIMVQSAVFGYTQGSPSKSSAPSWLADITTGEIKRIPVFLLVLIVFVAAAVLLQHYSRFGRYVQAMGANSNAAKIAGVRARSMTVLVYITSGLCAGLVGVLLLGFTGAPTLTMGEPYTFGTISAVVVGGSSILGGRGYFLGTVAGALLLTVLSNDITALGLGQGWRTIIEGLVIVGALSSFRMLERRQAA